MQTDFYSEDLDFSPERLKKRVEWRPLFPAEILAKAASKELQGRIRDFQSKETIRFYYGGCRAWFAPESAGAKEQPAVLKRRQSYRYDRYAPTAGAVQTQIFSEPLRYLDRWEKIRMTCTCEQAEKGVRCVHMAALLFRWEKEHGPWYVEENKYDYSLRQEKIKAVSELQRREKQKERYVKDEVPVLSFLQQGRGNKRLVFFDMQNALKDYVTTPYEMSRCKELLHNRTQSAHYTGYPDSISLEKARTGEQSVDFRLHFDDGLFIGYAIGRMEQDRLAELRTGALLRTSGVRNRPPVQPDDRSSRVLDEYALAAMSLVWDYVDELKDLGMTDERAERFFRSLEEADLQTKASSGPEEVQRKKVLAIEPRIVAEAGSATLTFKAGRCGGKLLVLKNAGTLVQAYRNREEYALSKKEIVNFALEDFDDASLPVMEFLIRRIGERQDVNEKLQQKAGYYRAASISVNSQLELKGSLLDAFYDMAEGRSCEFQDKTNKIKDAVIGIRHENMNFKLAMERLSDARGTFAGVTVSGFIPVMIEGSAHRYTLSSRTLSRISPGESRMLSPFSAVADESGYFRFQVGLDRLQEFYYRVLPSLLANPSVEIDDQCSEEVRNILPPEPEFVFYLDIEDNRLFCRCVVTYEDRKFVMSPGPVQPSGRNTDAPLRGGVRPAERKMHDGAGSAAKDTDKDLGSVRRDIEQEMRIHKVLTRYFTKVDRASGRYCEPMEEDALFRFLKSGISVLEQYGEVQGSEAFGRLKLRSVPVLSIGVSVSTGLMDIAVTSKGISEEELLDILTSYRAKKQYHRLRSGDFIDLGNNESLKEAEQLFEELSLSPEEAIRKGVKLPVYRALYLDKLLEEHDGLVSERDRTFRTLARNFRSIRDAEYEVPASLADVLRPYQAYGFKWLKTLESAGFGGILADEMGLGKTLQMIAVILYDRENGVDAENTGGKKKPSLIVCPASLVYNWQEEIRRFAPSLNCCALAGTPASRKKALEESGADVFITSYDLLKRDIAVLSDKTFHICVLDEAQYIKNSKAAAAKTVKALKCRHRFALTGTPIENRLSELWSIFDFLMPGFLYSYTDFARNFETPIAKDKNRDITERLKKLTAPFILRRKKEDVLKDLPAKLEEVRYAKLEGTQQKLYDAQVVRIKNLLEEKDETGEGKMRILAELTRIRQICCDPSLLFEDYSEESAKRQVLIETVRSAIDGGHRVLIFSQFTSMLSLLEKDLEAEGVEYYKIIGATPKDKRLAMVNAFNEGSVPVFLISLKAGGTGLNLTGADVVIHYDPWWNLAAQNQATDRAHRIGQTRQVTVYKLILKDTIEERIMDLQNAKHDLAEAILEGEASSLMSMSNEELMALLQ